MWSRRSLVHMSMPKVLLSIRQILAPGWHPTQRGVWGEENVVIRTRANAVQFSTPRHAAGHQVAQALQATMGATAPIPPSADARRPAADYWRVVSLARCSAVADSRWSSAMLIRSTSLTSHRTSVRSDATSAIAVTAAPASAEPRANTMDMMVSGDIALHRGD